jgi:hypothetical protein
MTDNRIIVIDSPVGSGKTTWAINHINNIPYDIRIIYITPFLKEVTRIIDSCPTRHFIEPKYSGGDGSKMVHFIKLISEGKNVVSTHALFSAIDNRVIDALKLYDYIFILDEVMNTVDTFDIFEEDIPKKKNKNEDALKEETEKKTIDEIKGFITKGILKVDKETNIVTWEDRVTPFYKYERLKKTADNGLLYFINGTLLIWTFPIQVFQEGIFSKIYVLTYLFNYQIQSSYFKFYNLDYDICHIEKVNEEYKIVETIDQNYDIEWKKKIKPLITICDNEKLNRIGSIYLDERGHPYKSALSNGWYERNNESGVSNKLGLNAINFFMHTTKTRTNQRMWTTFKDCIPFVKNKNLTKPQWIEMTSRSTNLHRDKTALAYLVNRYPQPYFEDFFETRNVPINQDHFAISEMIQWVFRSAIRDQKPISIYIPSERMRTLFMKWLDGKEPSF